MNVINIAGVEHTVDSRGWDAIVKRGEAHLFRKIPTRTMGRGPAHKIILLLYGNGIGDCIHSLPAIRAKLDAGFDITVMSEESLSPFYEKTGCSVIPVHQDDKGSVWTDRGSIYGFIPEHDEEYGVFYSLKHWCVAHDEDTKGESPMDRFKQFADYIEVELPKTFEWETVLL